MPNDKPNIKQTGAVNKIKDNVCIEGSHCPKIETYKKPMPAIIANLIPSNLYPRITAPAVTIVQGSPGSFAHGFAPIQSQLVNATTVSTQPNKISLISSMRNVINAVIFLVN